MVPCLLVRDVDENGVRNGLSFSLRSVVSYFTAALAHRGLRCMCRPGLCAFPAQFEALSEEVSRRGAS